MGNFDAIAARRLRRRTARWAVSALALNWVMVFTLLAGLPGVQG
jgi:hypothetical protein